ncbi:MAG: hypothetical protein NTU97_01120 [Candidatus Magasanikbacteria bacterium]|nr:hypothetical protein [Candidatus Magasanikbacteria bacterium]
MPSTHIPLYRQIIKEAWKITWHQKAMWLLGLFAFFIATGGALEVFSRNLNWVFTPHVPFFWGGFEVGWNKDVSVWPLAIMLVLICFGLFAFVAFMSIRSFIALILATDKYKADDKIDLDKIWHAGEKKFVSVLGVVVLFKIIIFLASFLSAFPLWFIWTGSTWQGWMWIYPAVFLLGVVIAVVSSFLMVLTSAYLTLKRNTFGKALKMAWNLFLNHWLVSLEMAVVIFFVNLLFGLISLAGMVIIAVPTFLFVVFGVFILMPVLSNVAIFVGCLLAILLILWIAGFLGAFHAVAWTLLFKKMEEGKAISKLHRLVDNLIGR